MITGFERARITKLREEIDRLAARVAELEAAIDDIIAYEWGDPAKGYRVPPYNTAWIKLRAVRRGAFDESPDTTGGGVK